MSLIAAICEATGQPVDPDSPRQLIENGLVLRASRSTIVVAGMIGLATRQFVHDLDAGDAVQPVESGSGRSVIVLDGRVDNREDIVRRLGGVYPGNDAALVALAYERWALACIPLLHGDFAWLLWDARRHRLVGARDAFGSRPLFYGWRGTRLVCGSQVDQVRTLVEAPADALSEDYLADVFVRGWGRPEASPYDRIHRLPPGHRLVLERGALTVSQYWDLSDAADNDIRDPAEQIARFGDLLGEAVRLQLRANGPVWSDLSGGLDSSSIASLAARQTYRAGLPPNSFATFSVVQQSHAANERTLQEAVCREYGLANHCCVADTHAFHDIVEGARHWDEPSEAVFFFALQREMARMLEQHNVAALLRGIGAECVVLSEVEPPFHLADLLREFQLRAFSQQLRTWAGALRRPLPVLAARYGLKPLLRPGRVSVELGTLRRPRPIPAWLDPGFVRRTNMTERKRRPWQPARFRSVVEQWQYEQFAHLTGYNVPGCMHKACDVRLPFLYRPLVEYAFRLPWTVKVQPGTNKPLLREAMRQIVPDEVRTWRRKLGATRTFHLGLNREFESLRTLLRDSRLGEAGIVNIALLEQELDRMRYGSISAASGGLRPLAVEAWIRARTMKMVATDAVATTV